MVGKDEYNELSNGNIKRDLEKFKRLKFIYGKTQSRKRLKENELIRPNNLWGSVNYWNVYVIRVLERESELDEKNRNYLQVTF